MSASRGFSDGSVGPQASSWPTLGPPATIVFIENGEVLTPAGEPTPTPVKATIVIATKNRGELAERAVQSALGQTVGEIEVVVVDDGSTPPFELATNDPRVSVIRFDESRGVCGARNAGLAAAIGDWIMFLDDDDEISPTLLELSLRAAERSTLPQPIAVLSGLEILDPQGARLTERLPPSLPKGKDYFLEGAPPGRGFTVGNTLVAPREVLARIGGFDEQLRSAVHTELLLRLNAVCSIEGVPEVTYTIKRHHGEHVHSNVLGRAQAMQRTVEVHREKFARHPRRYARYLSAAGIAFVRAGKWGHAVRLTTRAVRIDPRASKVLGSWLVALSGPYAVRRLGALRRRSERFKRRDSDPV